MAKKKSARKWMQGAVKRKGALTKKAEAAGESVGKFASEHKHDSGLTGQQSRFAITAKKIARKGKRKGKKTAKRVASRKKARR